MARKHPDLRTITIDTIAGRKQILAPAGWQYDKTARIAWTWMLNTVADMTPPPKLVREQHVLDGELHVLAIVMANSLGMAAHYWEQEAKRIYPISLKDWLKANAPPKTKERT